MRRHIVSSSTGEFVKIISGQSKYLLRFFKKRQEFLGEVKGGDLVFLKVGKEILGQFIIGKVIFIENFKKEDFKWITKIEGIQNILEKRDYEKDLERISIVLIIQTNKIEQLITSPIEVPIVRKDWIILED